MWAGISGKLGAAMAAATVAVTGLTLAAAPAVAQTDACAPLPKAGGGTWECTFDEEFNGSTLDASKWVPQVTATSGYTSGATACFVDRRANISVGGGALNLTARREFSPFVCTNPNGSFTTQYTSGMVSTWGKFSQAYGRFEFRAKIPKVSVPGLQSTLWLYPQDSRYGPWPASGEIDVAEFYSNWSNFSIPFVHYNPLLGVDPTQTGLCLVGDTSQYHTYAVEWDWWSMKFSFDGHDCFTDVYIPALPLTKAQPFDQPFTILMTQALGVAPNTFDPRTTPLPATTSVDYVRAWR